MFWTSACRVSRHTSTRVRLPGSAAGNRRFIRLAARGGRIVRLAARAGLIDTEAWRVNLREYHPVARFGASFYTRTNDRFSLSDSAGLQAPTSTGIDQI